MRHTRKVRNMGSVLLVLVLLAGALAFAASFICAGQSRPIRATSSLQVVEIDIRPSIELRPVIARRGSSNGELFSDIIARRRPYAAINGTYYDFDMRPLGDILIDGTLANRGRYRNAVAFTRKGKVVFLHKRRGRLDWTGCKSGIAAGPRLIHNGRIALDPVSDGFSRRSLTKKALRSGIGVTRNGKLLLVASRGDLTLGQLAREMLSLGAMDAMNLDGGSASGLYCDGKTLATPPLPMSNMLLVYR